VIVTGAAGNVGSGICEVFAADGAKLVCSDRAGERLSDVAKRLGQSNPNVVAIPCDLTIPAELKALVDQTVAKFGTVDALINCGAIPYSGPIAEEDAPDFDRMYHTNVRSLWLLTKYCVEPMRKNGGAIVNIASINAHRAQFFCALYSGTKAAVVATTRELAVELAPLKIRVNSVSPGLIPNPHNRLTWLLQQLAEPYAKQIDAEFTPKMAQVGLDAQPLRRRGHGHDIGMACHYLCSPAARFVTGEDLVVDGGKNQEMFECEPRFQQQQPFWKMLRARLMELPEEAWTGEKPKWLIRAKQQLAEAKA
jgi:3-oxoacyl-[acyl-carrier protein] reductase